MPNFKPAKIKRQQAEGMGELMTRFVNVNGLWDGLYRQAVFEAWDAESSFISIYVISKYLKDGILRVKISSSALRTRLLYQLPGMLESVNRRLAENELLVTLSPGGTVPPLKNIILN